MGSFRKCPHTCNHTPPTRNYATTYGYIFFYPGSSFQNHMRSKLHPNCSPACLGHLDHPQHQPYVEPTVEDWNEWADRLWYRYPGNSAAQAAIPAEYLNRTPANQASTPEEEDQEGGAGPDENPSIAVPSDTGLSFSAVGRVLVDRSVSTCSLPPRMRMTPANPDRADIIETPWVNPNHFLGTSFFTDPLTVAFVEDPTRRTTKTNAQRYDSWMCSNLNISDAWHKRFIRDFPKLAFGPNNKQGLWWEWVSCASFDLTNAPAERSGTLQLGVAYALGEMTGPGCRVKLIPWASYKQALLTGEGQAWDDLRSADLVVGGLHLECDFM